MYLLVHEDAEHRATPIAVRAVDLYRHDSHLHPFKDWFGNMHDDHHDVTPEPRQIQNVRRFVRGAGDALTQTLRRRDQKQSRQAVGHRGIDEAGLDGDDAHAAGL